MSEPDTVTIAQVSQAETREASRLEAFSDGVFAVAITLLVLDIKVPHSDARHIAADLLGQWPQYVAYFYSFIFIGVYWMNHHNMFKYVRRVDQKLMFLNIMMLALIALLPFGTGLLAVDLGRGLILATYATAVFNGIALLSAISMGLFWRYATSRPDLLEVSAGCKLLDKITRDYGFGALFCTIAFVLGFISVPLSLGIQLVLSIYFALPELTRGNHRTAQS